MYNLLTEPLLTYQDNSQTDQKATLPQLYAALAKDQVEAFPNLRPHQRHSWHSFLVQLAAIALQKAGLTSLPESEEDWLNIIQATTPEFPENHPWQLIVEDLTLPAFMQPPATTEEQADRISATSRNPKRLETPDTLDIINASKNHDVKKDILHSPAPEHWFLALINLQTMAGHIGQGNYPISRMQSGRNSRTAFSLTSSTRHGPHTQRDVHALMNADLSKWPMQPGGTALLWTIPWDGLKTQALNIEDLHPYYIEICRLRRLHHSPRGIYAVKASSAARTSTKELRGNVGDPWQLIDKRENGAEKAMAMQRHSFRYNRLSEYLFQPDKWDLPPLFSGEGTDCLLIARGIKADQGGTSEGLHERLIPIRERLATALQNPHNPSARTDIEDIAALATSMVRQASTLESTLRAALAIFATGDRQERTKDLLRSQPDRNPLRRKVDDWVGKLTQAIDNSFFEHLQQEFETEHQHRDDARRSWLVNHQQTGIIDAARNIFDEAIKSMPCQAGRYYRTLQAAEGLFIGQAYDMKRYDGEKQANT